VLLLPLPCHAAEEREASPLAGAGGGAEVGGMGERERAGGSRWEGAGGEGKKKRRG
jgi:hypothetical protein